MPQPELMGFADKKVVFDLLEDLRVAWEGILNDYANTHDLKTSGGGVRFVDAYMPVTTSSSSRLTTSWSKGISRENQRHSSTSARRRPSRWRCGPERKRCGQVAGQAPIRTTMPDEEFWDGVAGRCGHPREQHKGGPTWANCRLEVKLGSGKVIEVCRLCWELMPPPPSVPQHPAVIPPMRVE